MFFKTVQWLTATLFVFIFYMVRDNLKKIYIRSRSAVVFRNYDYRFSVLIIIGVLFMYVCNFTSKNSDCHFRSISNAEKGLYCELTKDIITPQLFTVFK